MKAAIISAFDEARHGFSADRTIADPEFRTQFVNACRLKGLIDSESDLCRKLLNLRKAGELSHLRSNQTKFADDEYRFASEIAVRHLERRDHVTLDDILCDETLLQEFDAVCEDLAPGHTKLQYRWAALSLRKSRAVSPEILGHALPATDVRIVRCATLDVESIEPAGGLYIFISERETLYVGEAENLRTRIRKHLDHSDNKYLARYIWERGMEEVRLEIHLLPDGCNTRVRRALERELIASRKPLFNILGKPLEGS